MEVIKLYKIYAVSDSIGETSELVARATASQFGGKIDVQRVPYLKTIGDVDNFIEKIEDYSKAMIISTIITLDVRKYLVSKCVENNIHVINVLGSCISMASMMLNTVPEYKPGAIWGIDSKYYKKIEAMEFAIQYDDSKDHSGIKHADVVLVGLSRTSKTPICMYLANRGIKALNVPLVPEVPVPEELYCIDRKKIIGLTIDPMNLIDIRRNRLNRMDRTARLSSELQYANAERILFEFDFAEKVMRRLNCKVIDVTNRAIEDTALLIMENLGSANKII
ncbi:MAG: pyruvate, water dikinase regulatory protein [Solirubrobacterales bacterium]